MSNTFSKLWRQKMSQKKFNWWKYSAQVMNQTKGKALRKSKLTVLETMR